MGQQGLLPRQGVGKPAEQLGRLAFAELDSGVAHQLRDSAEKGIQFAAALGEFLLALGELPLELRDLLLFPRQKLQPPGSEASRQAGGGQGRTPAPPHDGKFLFFAHETFPRRGGLLLRRREACIDGHQFFQGRKVLFRGRQSSGNGSSAGSWPSIASRSSPICFSCNWSRLS